MCVRHNGRMIHIGQLAGLGVSPGFYWCAELPGHDGSMTDMVGPYSDRDVAIEEAKRICDEQFDLLASVAASDACH